MEPPIFSAGAMSIHITATNQGSSADSDRGVTEVSRDSTAGNQSGRVPEGNDGLDQAVQNPFAPAHRSKPPGVKRLLVTLSTLVGFLAGVPVWYLSTAIHRAHLPFAQISSYASRLSSHPITPPVRVTLHLADCAQYSHESEAESSSAPFDWLQPSNETDILHQISGLTSNESRIHFSLRLDHTFECRSFLAALAGESDSESDSESDTSTTKGDLHHSNHADVSTPHHQLQSAPPLQEDERLDSWLHHYLLSNPPTPPDSLTIFIINTPPSPPPSPPAVVGTHRHAFTLPCGLTHATFQGNTLPLAARLVSHYFLRGGGSEKAPPGKGLPVSASGEAILSFTLLNADPSQQVYNWDFEEVEKRFLVPVVEALAPAVRLTVESQVLYYTPHGAEASWNPSTQSYEVAASDWPFFVNSNEWHLDTSAGAASRSRLLHFVVYIPSPSHSPLHLRLSSGRLSPTDAFISPGWGGVAIFNANPGGGRLGVEELSPYFGTFVAQLRTLFGLPGVPLFENPGGGKGGKGGGMGPVRALFEEESGFADWEVMALTRGRGKEDVGEAVSALGSLANLVKSLPRMVIKDEIGRHVTSALTSITAAESFAQNGNQILFAQSAVQARSKAEEAFFDPSVMSLLYNPLEHLVAVYAPFFVPVTVHVVLSFVKEVKRYREETRKYSSFLLEKQRPTST